MKPFLPKTIAAVALGVSCSACGSEKRVQGVVFDCATNAPVPDARLWTQQHGWGYVEQHGLVWDKLYVTESSTAADGRFVLAWRVGPSAHLLATAPGYKLSQGWVAPSDDVRVGLVKGASTSPADSIQACRPVSECMRSRMVDGVQVVDNTCPDI